MEKVTVDALLDQRSAVAGHAIDYHPLDVLFLDNFDDLCEMYVDVQLLRAFKQHLDGAVLDLFAQIQAKSFGIADNLRRVLIEGDQQAALSLLQRALAQNLCAKNCFPHAGKPDHHRGGAVEDPAAE